MCLNLDAAKFSADCPSGKAPNDVRAASDLACVTIDVSRDNLDGTQAVGSD
jgi:hypothetical protein